MPQFRRTAAGQHGRNVRGIINDARAFVNNAARRETHGIPNNLAVGDYGDEVINNRTYRFCVRIWRNVPINEKGSRTSGFRTDPDNNDIAIHCTVDGNVVTGIYHVVLNNADRAQWQANAAHFRRETLRDMARL